MENCLIQSPHSRVTKVLRVREAKPPNGENLLHIMKEWGGGRWAGVSFLISRSRTIIPAWGIMQHQ